MWKCLIFVTECSQSVLMHLICIDELYVVHCIETYFSFMGSNMNKLECRFGWWIGCEWGGHKTRGFNKVKDNV